MAGQNQGTKKGPARRLTHCGLSQLATV